VNGTSKALKPPRAHFVHGPPPSLPRGSTGTGVFERALTKNATSFVATATENVARRTSPSYRLSVASLAGSATLRKISCLMSVGQALVRNGQPRRGATQSRPEVCATLAVACPSVCAHARADSSPDSAAFHANSGLLRRPTLAGNAARGRGCTKADAPQQRYRLELAKGGVVP
jgi:hypothetical protein